MEEWLCSAEYIAKEGNTRIVLCERGVRTSCNWDHARSILDLNIIQPVRQATPLPIIADPSHATGKWEYVSAAARASIAAGADGLIIEVHHRPEEALSDGAQSLKPERFAKLVTEMKAIAQAVDRNIN